MEKICLAKVFNYFGKKQYICTQGLYQIGCGASMLIFILGNKGCRLASNAFCFLM